MTKNNRYLYESIMKKVAKIVKSSINESGHWEDYYDEDTGENTQIFVEDKPKNMQQYKDSLHNRMYKDNPNREEIVKLRNKIDEINDKISETKYLLKCTQEDVEDLRIDMEDEIGQYSDDATREELGNDYGERMNELENDILDLTSTIKELTAERNKLENKRWELE